MAIDKEKITAEFNTRFIKVFDLQYAEGKHYFDATRRDIDNLVACKSDEEFKKMLPDAVSMAVVLKVKGEEPVLCLNREYRYPCGQYLLSVPAGLIDAADKEKENPLLETARRELKEEMGIDILPSDSLKVVNPLLFSTPGMTDESNGFVMAVLNREQMPQFSQDLAEGSESFDGVIMVTRDKAIEILKNGTDDREIFYSVYTWIGLMIFVSGLWG